MLNLIKIKNVCLYVGITDNTDDCITCKNILKDNNIPHTVQMCFDEKNQELSLMQSRVFGPNFTQHEIKDFPFVIWTEFYDDYERFMEIALTLEELSNSNLVKYKNLVE
jgi:hypothetical protein